MVVEAIRAMVADMRRSQIVRSLERWETLRRSRVEESRARFSLSWRVSEPDWRGASSYNVSNYAKAQGEIKLAERESKGNAANEWNRRLQGRRSTRSRGRTRVEGSLEDWLERQCGAGHAHRDSVRNSSNPGEDVAALQLIRLDGCLID